MTSFRQLALRACAEQGLSVVPHDQSFRFAVIDAQPAVSRSVQPASPG